MYYFVLIGLAHLKGFKIEYEYKDSGEKICRILDYSEFLEMNKSISNVSTISIFKEPLLNPKKMVIYMEHINRLCMFYC